MTALSEFTDRDDELDDLMVACAEFTATPEPLTFEELVWNCPNCGWTTDLCTEHRALADEIRAEEEADARREES